MNENLTKISVITELSRLGLQYDVIGTDEVRCECPAHLDTKPSCTINTSKRLWKCHTAGCGRSGDIVTFIALMCAKRGTPIARAVVWEEMTARYNIEDESYIDNSIIEHWHDNISNAGPLLQELYDRGVTDGMIDEYRFGFDGERITIPIRTEHGCINVRKYLPGGPPKTKMISMRGRGANRLFPINQLSFNRIVICGGEIKAVVTAGLLNIHGIGAISTTGGEGSWTTEFNEAMRGKSCYVMMDVDQPGQLAAQKLCILLVRVCTRVANVLLPLDIDKFPKGDVNDYVGRLNKTDADLLTVVENAPVWEPVTLEKPIDPLDDILNITLQNAANSSNTGRTVRLVGTVTAVDVNPYIVPRDIKLTCARDQKFCVICPLYAMKSDENGSVTTVISQHSQMLLSFIESTKPNHPAIIKDALRMPPCKAVHIAVQSHWNIEDLRLVPPLDASSSSVGRNESYVMQPAFFVGRGLEGNTDYEMVGRLYPDPRTQKAVFLASSAIPSRDAFASFKMSDEDLNALGVFRPHEWTVDAVKDKLEDIYDDLSHNVTRIYCRDNMHLMMDLAFHSPLYISGGEAPIKGWVETLIIGDSAQGKSEVVTSLLKHYGIGEKIDCKNASVAGLLGGLQQVVTRWFVMWGIIPQNDRRLVVLEELKGAKVEVISKLTDMRSSGVAEIPKIEKRRTHARTRLIAISNPRSDQPMSTYNYGIDAVMELVGSPEDVRRFDAILVVASSQVSSDLIAKERLRVILHEYSSLLCRNLILWTWTRSLDQIVFLTDAETELNDSVKQLTTMFVDDIPIVDKGSIWQKVRRLSVALAARTASIEEDRIVVRSCHVQFMREFLINIYSEPTCGYSLLSRSLQAARNIYDDVGLKRMIESLVDPKTFVSLMLSLNDIDINDICDATLCDRIESQTHLSFLVRVNALSRKGRMYRKTVPFITFLRTFNVGTTTFTPPKHTY